MNMPR